MINDWAAWMTWFHERKIYTIARIVVFQDEPLATAHPEWAVLEAETGAVWRDRENLGWTDPMREEVWDYNIALAVEAAQQGFDEIQFGYVRFPADGAIQQATFARENSQENRVAAITGFLAKAQEALAPYDVKLAVDVFGYTTWRTDDTGIGQQLEAMAPYLDVLSPMLYPSTFEDGLPGQPEYKAAIAFSYEIVNLSTARAVNRVQAINPAMEVRPWIQVFPTTPSTGAPTPRTRSDNKWKEPDRPGRGAGCYGTPGSSTRPKRWCRPSRLMSPIPTARCWCWNII